MVHVCNFPISLALLLGAANIEAFSISTENIKKAKLMFTKPEFDSTCRQEYQHHKKFDSEVCRRASSAMLLSLVIATGSPATALESRNESVCSTGLFEHFQEWRCTPIGNILDEGNPKKLNSNEETKIDSLMDKLGVNLFDDDETTEKEKSSKMKNKKDTKNNDSKTLFF